MTKLVFNVLVVISLLPELCGGVRPFCPDGYLDKKTIDEYILKTVNARRQALTGGKQRNGETGTNLPAAKDMTKVRWSCELEQIAIAALGTTCVSQRRVNPKGLADFFHHESNIDGNYSPQKTLRNVLKAYLVQIDSFYLDVPSGATEVNYNGDEQLETYANLVRSANKEIGCAINGCSGTRKDSKVGEGTAMYCVLNSR
ncbi:hypothetical protein Y032_0013g1938 [Ancylostoma ceylanicum]|nr:hypothetical protein Y032_0013g1938 [Ancylostoma ceylanicum]